MDTDRPKRVFISYSWTSSSHEGFVLRLAERLMSDGVDDLPTDDKSIKYVKMLYDLRSKILHRGYLFQGDLAIPGYYTSEEADQRSLLMNLVSITRKRLIQWLLDQ